MGLFDLFKNEKRDKRIAPEARMVIRFDEERVWRTWPGKLAIVALLVLVSHLCLPKIDKATDLKRPDLAALKGVVIKHQRTYPGAAREVREIIERDKRGEYSQREDFDGALWTSLCDVVDSPQSVTKLPEPVWVYYATRLIEGEVGNGGFAQAAMNIPEWFELAAKGNEILGKPELAAFIREASKLASSEAQRIQKARKGGLGSAFAYFREGNFERFDRRLDEIGWWCDEERIAYVRANSEAFIGLDAILSGKVHY